MISMRVVWVVIQSLVQTGLRPNDAKPGYQGNRRRCLNARLKTQPATAKVAVYL
jgi:hypothetical protein